MKLAQVYQDYLLHQRSQSIKDFSTQTQAHNHLDTTYQEDSYLQADSNLSGSEQLHLEQQDQTKGQEYLQDRPDLEIENFQNPFDSPTKQESPESPCRKSHTAWTDSFTPISSFEQLEHEATIRWNMLYLFESQFLFGTEHQPPTAELSIVPEASASSDSESSEIPHSSDIAGLDAYLASLGGLSEQNQIPVSLTLTVGGPQAGQPSLDKHRSPSKQLRTHSQHSPLLSPERQNALDRSNSLDGITPKGKHRPTTDQSQFERLRSLRQNTGAPQLSFGV